MPVEHVFAVAGAKGGVGKTTTSINLGTALADRGRSVAVVETDIAMANMVDFLDLDFDPESDPSLHEVLAGESAVEEAIYDAPGGIDVVPSGVDLDGFAASDTRRLQDAIGAIRNDYDVVILDTGAGLSQETLYPLGHADEVLLVSTPRVASVRDTKKTMELAERVESEVRGVIFAKSGTGRAPPVDHIASFLGTDLLGHVPETEDVPNSQDVGRPVTVNVPESTAAAAYEDIASTLNGSLEDDGSIDEAESGRNDGQTTGPGRPEKAGYELGEADAVGDDTTDGKFSETGDGVSALSEAGDASPPSDGERPPVEADGGESSVISSTASDEAGLALEEASATDEETVADGSIEDDSMGSLLEADTFGDEFERSADEDEWEEDEWEEDEWEEDEWDDDGNGLDIATRDDAADIDPGAGSDGSDPGTDIPDDTDAERDSVTVEDVDPPPGMPTPPSEEDPIESSSRNAPATEAAGTPDAVPDPETDGEMIGAGDGDGSEVTDGTTERSADSADTDASLTDRLRGLLGFLPGK